ncbi:MAG: HEPN domain-containing protein [bacterium]|jgi:HEPN domain-containing protein
MKREVIEWVDKAEGDFISAKRECRARKMPNFDAACFHAQQSAEKYLKAYLQELNIPIPKTHDLVRLLSEIPPTPALDVLRSGMATLTAYAVEFRYPGECASQEVAKEAITLSGAVRDELRHLLSLSVR